MIGEMGLLLWHRSASDLSCWYFDHLLYWVEVGEPELKRRQLQCYPNLAVHLLPPLTRRSFLLKKVKPSARSPFHYPKETHRFREHSRWESPLPRRFLAFRVKLKVV